jgi:hypothetical protein
MNAKVNVSNPVARPTSKASKPVKPVAAVPEELLTSSLLQSATDWLMKQGARDVQEHAVSSYIGQEQGKYFEREGKKWSGFDCKPMEDAEIVAGRISSGDAVALGLAQVIDGEVRFVVTRFGIHVDSDTGRRTIIFE